MSSFAHQQEQMRTAMQQTMGNFFPFPGMQEVGRQNMAMMERAMTLFAPFYRPPDAPANGTDGLPPESAPTNDTAALQHEIENLRLQLAAARAAAIAADKPAEPTKAETGES
jgi:polyhydroxyalkanoate synthesis regulator protein